MNPIAESPRKRDACGEPLERGLGGLETDLPPDA